MKLLIEKADRMLAGNTMRETHLREQICDWRGRSSTAA